MLLERSLTDQERAVSSYEQTLTDAERLARPDHPTTITARHNLTADRSTAQNGPPSAGPPSAASSERHTLTDEGRRARNQHRRWRTACEVER